MATTPRSETGIPVKRHEVLKNLSIVLAASPDLKSLAKTILETLIEAMGAENGSLFLLNEGKGAFIPIHSNRLKMESNPASFLPKEDPLVQYLMREGEPFCCNESDRSEPADEKARVVESMSLLEAAISIPLLSKGKLVGFMNLGRRPLIETYGPEDKDWLSLVANLSVNALENRRLAEDLRKSKSHIQRADRLASLGTLTAALAHELRNPLVAIKTFTQLLPERFEDDEFRNHFLRIVSGEVDRISTLINELLEFARPSDPKVEAENVNAILESILFLVSTGTKKKQMEIIKDFSPNLPSVPIDREQIKQVFLNILINAIEATEDGGKIYVKTRAHLHANGGPCVQVEITDTGCGISSEHLDSIFHPFFTTKHKGSGLGLSISNQIVQEHKGSIDVESHPNEGSTFYVNLPLHPGGPVKGKRGQALRKGEVPEPLEP